MVLDAIAVKFYRGIGPNVQVIGPFSRLNFFIGPNNSGKSVVLNLIFDHVKRVVDEGGRVKLNPVERYSGKKSGNFSLAVGCARECVKENIFKRLKRSRSYHESSGPIFDNIVDNILEEISIDGLIFCDLSNKEEPCIYPEVNIKSVDPRSFGQLWTSLTNQNGGDPKRHWIPETMSVIASCAKPSLPEIYLIPAKRQLGEGESEFEDLSGRGLIEHLAEFERPDFDKQEERIKFEKINEFLKNVNGKMDARLEVPNNKKHLLVHMDNKVLPLSSLGTGIHEVVLIAAFCTIYDGSIMCIEEPEIHLHPVLQRKLINYILANTSSQYFIATHSSSFIDTEDASVFAVHNDSEQTYITRALTKSDKKSILDSMGYLASDLLQANVVIWVEGPSDRIYMNHWISSYNSDLIEGIHYTIMFYGGSLIRHLAASDEAADEFIHLQDLNRNMIIIFDSDKDADDAALKPNVKRVSEEIEKNGGIAWITAGREIETYIDHRLLQSALAKVHPKIYDGPSKGGKFDNSFHFYRPDPKNNGKRKLYKEADKVGVAEYVCSYVANFDIYDLRARIGEVCDFIIRANRVD